MSMLAERRRKQKYSLNPNGKAWVQDSNKFGQKLLEKMGWQHGKGLGANEDGMTEHIKVSHKMDSKGMGYKETDGQWTEHESNFTALLSALSGDKIENEPEAPLKSLEKKSQNSRARVHYKKFTRGKDLSRYSEKDLANIFGKKSLKSEPSKEGLEEPHTADTESKESGFYFSGGSMTDYFKKKLPKFGKINDSYTIGNNGVLIKARDSESESEMKPSFGFGFNSYQEDMPVRMKAEENHLKEVGLSANKNKVDKKQKNNEDLGQSNPAFDPLANLVMKLERHNLAPIEEIPSNYMDENIDTSICENEEISKIPAEGNETLNKNCEKMEQNNSGRKERKQTDIVQIMELQEGTIIEQETSGSTSVRTSDVLPSDDATQCKKKKMKKEKIMLYDNPSFQFQNSLEESLAIHKNSYKVKIEMKKNKKKMHLVNTQNNEDKRDITITITENETSGSCSVGTADVLPSDSATQSKKKKRKREKMLYDNPSFQFQNSLEESLVIDKNPYEVKIKEQKKKKLLRVNTQDNEDEKYRKSKIAELQEVTIIEKETLGTSSLGTPVVLPSDNATKSKNKKRKKEKMLYDNPTFQFQNSLEESSIMDKNPYEVEIKKQKKDRKSKIAELQEETIIGKEPSGSSSVGTSDVQPSDEATKSKKKKRRKEKMLYDNPSFQYQNSLEESSVIDKSPYEVKIKEQKKKKLLHVNTQDNEDEKDIKSKIAELQEETIIEQETIDSSSVVTSDVLPSDNATKSKKKKRKEEKMLYDNPSFQFQNSPEESLVIDKNPYEVKIKEQKKKRKLLNVNNQDNDDKKYRKSKMKKSEQVLMEVENAGFCDIDEIPQLNTAVLETTTIGTAITDNPYEVKPKKRKESRRIAPSVRNENPTQGKNSAEGNINTVQSLEPDDDSALFENYDLMLNIVSTPIIEPVRTPKIGSVTKENNLKRRKSVRFSDVTQEVIIPNNDDLREMYDEAGMKNMDSISKTLDNFQAEMENDINEEKIKIVSLEDIMIGEVGNPHGENEKLPEGTKLKFKYARLHAKTPFYQMNQQGAKKAYKHLIKGDIMVKFQNTNLHEIEGYAINNKTVA